MTLPRLFAMGLTLAVVACGAVAHAADSVRIDTLHRVQTIRPQFALGSTVDKEPAGSIPALYSHANVAQMLEAGYGFLSYRLFTELSVQDWHWNPAGHFSTPAGGYWTSDASSGGTIADSYGYRLPHSGFTSDQGNNEGYSRIDDGNPRTYWKSNPYLSSRFTGDPDSEHPQWVVVDAGSAQTIDAIAIHFAQPYARAFRIEYWTGSDPMNDPANGRWLTFVGGNVTASTLRQASATRAISTSRRVRYVRIMLLQSSRGCDAHGTSDPRNCVGYAIAEISLGHFDRARRMIDALIHRPCGGEKAGQQTCGLRQSATFVSSVDPWHNATSRVKNQEQPGLDLIARSGLTRNIGAYYPVPMIYSTPENAAAEVRYLRARHYPIAGIELGEEPDGQYVTPEDDAAFYLQWAHAIHAVDPSLRLGGPVFSGVNDDLQTWANSAGDVSWLHRFLAYLRSHHAIDQLAFMSFEHYPFDGCEHGAALTLDLLDEPAIMARVVAAWRRDGLPPSVPLYITEANFSAVNFTETPMRIEGALWQADYMASALTDGVASTVYYQYEPVPRSQNTACPSNWGNLTMFVGNNHGTIRARAAQFWAGRMLTHEWFAPSGEPAELYRASTTARLAHRAAITVYPLRRTDGTWSVMLINKDSNARVVTMQFAGGNGAIKRFVGRITQVTFGPAQYRWHRNGVNSLPSPDGPPLALPRTVTPATRYELPGRSITILRGTIR